MKKIYFILLMFFFSCNENDTNVSNGHPSDFEVTVNSNIYNNVSINWSESFDPEDLQVKYSVYINNNLLATDLVDRNYSFQDLNPSTEYDGKVIAFDLDNNTTTSYFTIVTSGNLPPSLFQLTSLTTTNVSANVAWEASIDPEGENVTYNLFINNEIVESNYNSIFYIFENLQAATTYNAKIIAIDNNENSTVLEFIIETNDGIFQGDVNLSSQNSVNTFGNLGYIEITGDLEIASFGSNNSDIIDLSPLSSIKIVREYFHIYFMGNLTSLLGLGIEHVGKSFRINNNNGLENLDGLENLHEVLGGFEIKQNSNLITISGINNLITIGSGLSVHNNINLIEISGFNSLSLINHILIKANWSLEQMNSFNTLTEVSGDLNINENPLLSTITGLENIIFIERFFLRDTLITNMDAFSSLTTVSLGVSIQNNSLLENIEGLSSFTGVTYSSFNFDGNSTILSLDGLENFSHIGSYLHISGNDNLSDFCALQNLMQTYNTPQSFESLSNNAYNPTFTDISNGNCSL